MNNSFLHLCIDASSRLSLYMYLFRSFTYYEKNRIHGYWEKKNIELDDYLLIYSGYFSNWLNWWKSACIFEILVSFKNIINFIYIFYQYTILEQKFDLLKSSHINLVQIMLHIFF